MFGGNRYAPMTHCLPDMPVDRRFSCQSSAAPPVQPGLRELPTRWSQSAVTSSHNAAIHVANIGLFGAPDRRRTALGEMIRMWLLMRM